jgi:short-subunit dehydrogenase
MPTALVTGGTSGIGAAFARALAARGDDLVLVARDADRLSQTAGDLKERHGVDVEVFPADLANPDDVARVAERLSSTDRPVDTLVNNAGIGVRARLTDADLGPHDHAIDVMVRAVLHLAGAAARAMRERGRGTIINVGSTSSYVALGDYSAIKAWVSVYTESLAVELAGTGVQATVLCPGWVRTEFHDRASLNVSAIPGALWLDADKLVADALIDAAKGKVVSIPSRRYKLLILFARHLPRRTIRVISAKINSRRHT